MANATTAHDWAAAFVARHHVIDGNLNYYVRVNGNCNTDCDHDRYPGTGRGDFGTVKTVTGIDMGLISISSGLRTLRRHRDLIADGTIANGRVVRTYADIKTAQDAGKIAEMNAIGMVVDVSHCSKQTTLDAAALSTEPIIATHVNAEALTPRSRNKDDEELLAIAATGGVIGVTTIRGMLDTDGNGAAGMEDFIAHVEYMVGLVGIDHVGISSDARMDGWEPTSVHYADADLAALDRWVRLAARLYARGWTEEDLAKLLGGNFRRVFGEVLASQ